MNYKYNEITGEFEKAPEARKTKTKEVKTIGDYFSTDLAIAMRPALVAA